MSLSLDPSLRTLNECGCCKGISAQTPVKVSNRPGLKAIMYRVGTHAQFKETMLARLSGSRLPALNTLTTRENDDFAIALLDAWATVADVLTFYQERLAQEAYLRTATERVSVLELARLIGYELRPGVAAGTYLAFTLEDAPGALGQALSPGITATENLESLPPISIDVGTKVQSIPGPGEQAVTFETVEKIEARAAWNAIKSRLTRPQPVSTTADFVIFQGTATNLKQGDTLLIVKNGSTFQTHEILNVTVDDEAKTTRADFVSPPAVLPGYERPEGLPEGSLNDYPTKVELNDAVVQQIAGQTWSEADLSALIEVQGWSATSLAGSLARQMTQPTLEPGSGVYALRQCAAIFGYNAPRQPVYELISRTVVVKPPSEWAEWPRDAEEANNRIFLDNAYDGILPKSYIAVAKPGMEPAVFTIDQVTQRPRTAYGMSAKTTLLSLAQGQSWWTLFSANNPTNLGAFRDVAVYAQSEALALAEIPIDDPVQGNSLTLDKVYLGLKVGRRVILTGERSDLAGVMASETLILKKVIIEAGFTVLTFEHSLLYSYVRQTVTINANVAQSTHGESVQETLGGGDAGQSFQRFTLRQPPLTYVSAATPAGSQTTLEVRVNDILWHEVPSLLSHGPEERIYVTRTDDDGKSTVMFGDGKTGARLPTGQENVTAKYRKGIGLPGLVKANQLTQLMTRPLGVKGVTNPAAASGADDREQLDEARNNAPLTVLTLDRVVSLQDYEDFARSFSGIRKALATWTWSGEKRAVFVTIAGVKGAEVKADSALYQHLLNAMQAAGNPKVSLVLHSFQPRFFRLAAAVKVDADYLPEKVLAAVEQGLRDSFSFEARAFGQPVNLSEVMAVMQSVPGVVAVDVKQFYRSEQPIPLNPPPRLEAALPTPGERQVFPAEILMLDSRPVGLEVLP